MVVCKYFLYPYRKDERDFMRTEQELFEYIGKRISELREKCDNAKSSIERRIYSSIIQEYKELLEFYQGKE